MFATRLRESPPLSPLQSLPPPLIPRRVLPRPSARLPLVPPLPLVFATRLCQSPPEGPSAPPPLRLRFLAAPERQTQFFFPFYLFLSSLSFEAA